MPTRPNAPPGGHVDGPAPEAGPADGHDGDLARRFAAGDPEALRELFDRYAGAVLTVALSRLRHRDLAEEAVQDTFVKAWRAAARFDPRRALRPWLYAIARRSAADIARRERRRPATDLLPAATPAPEAPGDPWEAWQVRMALDDLPAGERELLRLTHFVGLTQSEVAAHLGLPLGTVKSRVHRAHRRLAARLAHLRDVP
jgi:RNA polymerase sigma-70 factor (ECF subfamily)